MKNLISLVKVNKNHQNLENKIENFEKIANFKKIAAI